MPSDKKSMVATSTGNTQVDLFKESLKLEGERIVRDLFPVKILEINALINSQQFELSRLPEFDTDCGIPIPTDPIYATSGFQNSHYHDVEMAPPPVPISGGDDVKTGFSSSSTTTTTTRKRVSGSSGCIETDVITTAATGYPGGGGTKVYAFSGGVVQSNRKITELVEIVKPLVREAVEYVNKVKMWILFLIPRIEDGNNFGVSIQEETLTEVRTVEAEAASFLDQISRYYLTRGKIVAKVAKYPHVEDYRRSIVDLDQKEYWNLRLVLMELRNHYGNLHDMIMKNLEKIKIPRTSNVEHLY